MQFKSFDELTIQDNFIFEKVILYFLASVISIRIQRNVQKNWAESWETD